MANFDVNNDTTPSNKLTKPSAPLISDLRSWLLSVNSGLSYPAAVLNTMSENDMIYACRVHNLNPNGLPK